MLGASLFSTTHLKTMSAPQYVAAKPTTLYGSGISSADTTIRLQFLKTPGGTNIQTADLIGGASGPGSVFYGTIEPSTVRKETVSCTTVTQNSDGTATLAGCSRGLLFVYPYTASTSLAISHSGGSGFVISNSPQLYNDIINYVASTSYAGVVDATQSIKGIVELATGNEAASHKAVGAGDTSAGLTLWSGISSSTRTANTAQVVVSSSTDGYIDPSYLDSTRVALTSGAIFSGNLSMSGTATSTFASTTVTAYVATTTTTNGGYTWTKPSNLKFVMVEEVGGGAGGDDDTSGSAGAYCRKVIPAVAIPSTVFISVGHASAGNSGSAASDAGATTFGSIGCTANGGTNATAATPSTATGGDVNIDGGGGTAPFQTDSGSSRQICSGGGISYFGGSRAMFNGDSGGNCPGGTSTVYGTGGGGSTGTGAGGDGASGLLILTSVFY